MNNILKKTSIKAFSVFMAGQVLLQTCLPITSFALTSGPTQPEVRDFEPVGTSEMVDLFTGDFTYNIPLFELPGPDGGYPFNLAYHSGVTMDQEASWVGLGWSLNPGAINRNMRGIPDEFNGEKINITQHIKPNFTVGAKFKVDKELLGSELGKVGYGLGMSLFYNNYKGIGYSVSPSASLSLGKAGDKSLSTNISLDLNSQNGISLQPSIGLNQQYDLQNRGFNLGSQFNSRKGLTDITLTATIDNGPLVKSMKSLPKSVRPTFLSRSSIGLGGLMSIGRANSAFSPTISKEMEGRGINLHVDAGSSAFGFSLMTAVSAYFNTEYLKNNGKTFSKKAYGYNNLQNTVKYNAKKGGDIQDTDVVMDINREKEGALFKESRNMDVPVMTNDMYSISGQGVGGNFRAYRSDIAVASNPFTVSRHVSGSGGVEFGVGAGAKFGVDLDLTVSEAISGNWGENQYHNIKNNSLSTTLLAQKSSTGDLFEPYYYKNAGEPTTDQLDDLEYIGDSDPVRPVLERKGGYLNKRMEVKSQFEKRDHHTTSKTIPANAINPTKKREARNQINQEIKKQDIHHFKEFKTKYYDLLSSGSLSAVKEYNYKMKTIGGDVAINDNHNAAFVTTNSNGTRYVYGLPAYNSRHIEYQFSADNNNSLHSKWVDVVADGAEDVNYEVSKTNEYYNKKEIPAYAHSHLLTSVLGSDYMDLDAIPGPSVGDPGYWVNFNYARPTEVYKWRAPYSQANYIEGNKSDPADDLGTFHYGERENWYLTKVETKSHVALFHISKRQDARGVASITQNTNMHGAYSYKLDYIELFTKPSFESANPEPIKTIYFEYDYSLCPEVENNAKFPVDKDGNPTINDGADDINAKHGKLTLKKIWFKHRKSKRGKLTPYKFEYDDNNNPSYNRFLYDRWGQYKFDASKGSKGDNELYNVDFPYVEQKNNLSNVDKNCAAWNMTKIQLPSGATIKVDYESDDYAYVQDRVAMQMTPIVAMGDGTNGVFGDDDTRIFFELEKPFLDNSTNRAFYEEAYFGTVKDESIYFKTFMNVRNHKKENAFEYVKGYAEVEGYGFDESTKDVLGNFTRGYVKLKKVKRKEKGKWHPFSYAGWQYLKYERPEMAKNIRKYKDNKSVDENKGKEIIGSLLSNIVDVQQMISGFYSYAKSKNWCRKIEIGKSYIRLNTPDRIKKGGGLRVKKITLNDHWSQSTRGESDSRYGQVYEYTKQEKIAGQSVTISSGVAAYEPTIGGDENAVKRLKDQFRKKQFLMSQQLVASEYPYNESYFPAPVVGYSEVKVKSLATYYEGQTVDNYEIPNGISTTGMIQHEFFTAKDFPVLVNETDLHNEPPLRSLLTIPFVGYISQSKKYFSQGYSIESNDMHGKQKKVSSYRQKADGSFESNPYSWLEYVYQDKVENGYRKLDNQVTVLTDLKDQNGMPKKEQRILGQDYDFFVDLRQNVTHVKYGGAGVNTDVIYLPPIFVFAVPTFWPHIRTSTNGNYMASTNKVIRKTGILTKIKAYDQGTYSETKNLLYDETGQVLLTSSTNSFGDPVYQYNIPAHLAYEGMGEAYKNIGYIFEVTFNQVNNQQYVVPVGSASWEEVLFPGDELLVDGKKVYYSIKEGGNHWFQAPDGVTLSSNVKCMITRSGRRNHLTASAGNVVALSDPTNSQNIETKSCSVVEPTKLVSNVNMCRPVDRIKAEAIQQHLQSALDAFVANNMQVIDFNIPLSSPAYGWNVQHSGIMNIHRIQVNNYGGPQNIAFMLYDDIQNRGVIMTDYFPLNLAGQVSIGEPRCSQVTSNYLQFDLLGANGNVLDVVSIGYTHAKHIVAEQKEEILLTQSNTNFVSLNIDNILSASAITYKDSWAMDFSQLKATQGSGVVWTQQAVENLRNAGNYINGSRGTWRPYESWVYNGERTQGDFVRKSNTSNGVNDIDLSQDGVMNNVPFFDWDNTWQYKCHPEWTRVSSVTRYNADNNQIESEDALGIKSTALFGYNGQLPTAVAANASQEEILYEGFEEYDAGQAFSSTANLNNSHFNFLNGYQPTGNYYRLNDLRVESAKDNLLVVDLPYPTNASNALTNITFDVFGHHLGSMSATTVAGKFVGNQLPHPDPNVTDKSVIELDGFGYTGLWTGVIAYNKVIPNNGQNNSVIISPVVSTNKFKAHTGKNCFRSLGKVYLHQMKFEPGEKYLFQAWVSAGDLDHVNTFADTTTITSDGKRIMNAPKATLEFWEGTQVLTSVDLHLVGRVINHWQKIEGTFTVPQECDQVALNLSGGISVATTNSGYYHTVFWDDVRILPSDGNLVSHVYDKNDYRLSATLDANNFATYYFYNAAGGLYLTKRETEKGIVTLSENQSHIQEK